MIQEDFRYVFDEITSRQGCDLEIERIDIEDDDNISIYFKGGKTRSAHASIKELKKRDNRVYFDNDFGEYNDDEHWKVGKLEREIAIKEKEIEKQKRILECIREICKSKVKIKNLEKGIEYYKNTIKDYESKV